MTHVWCTGTRMKMGPSTTALPHLWVLILHHRLVSIAPATATSLTPISSCCRRPSCLVHGSATKTSKQITKPPQPGSLASK